MVSFANKLGTRKNDQKTCLHLPHESRRSSPKLETKQKIFFLFRKKGLAIQVTFTIFLADTISLDNRYPNRKWFP